MNFKSILAASLCVGLLASAYADDYDNIKKKGVLTVGVKDTAPPFGMRDARNNTVYGYDVDFALAIAKHMGVRVEVKAVDPAERIPKLQKGEVDMVIATMSKTPEREKLVDFSSGYFIASQKFIVPKGKVNNVSDLAHSRIGVAAGSASEKQLHRELPTAQLVQFDENKPAVDALGRGELDAVSSDEPILAGLLYRMPNKQNYEITPQAISIEVYGIAVRKGEKHLQQEVNDTLASLEASGEAERIFNRWFGPNSTAPMPRTFKIKGY